MAVEQLNQDLLKLLPADAKLIIEFGCGSGATGARYKLINPYCFYIGIESNPELANLAKERLDKVAIAPLENNPNLLDIQPGSVDCLVYGSTLAEISNPASILTYHKTLLKDDGQVLAIIPNIQHWRRIVNLIKGEWENPENLKQWFTLDSLKLLFAEVGLQVYEIQTRGSKGEEFQRFRKLMEPMANALGLSVGNLATQTAAEYYIVRATKSPVPPRRLLVQTIIMAPTGCDRVRVLEPDRFTSTIPGIRTISAVKSADLNAPLPAEEKVFIWQRTIMTYSAHIQQLKNLLQRGYLIVAEIDDNPIRRREYADNNYLSYRGCHCVQTSTEPLADFLRQYNPNVAVFGNHLAYLPPPRNYDNNQKVTIFFGALNREKDWQPIMPSINKLLSEYGEKIRFKIIHDRLFWESLNTTNKEFEPFCSYERYKEILYSCDIALLPLNDNPVNPMKSDLKFVESAGYGAAVLASPTVYEKFIVEGETGLIYRSVDEFEAKLRELIKNTNLRHKLAANAYNWVRENRLLCQHYRQRRDWYLQMRDRLPRLNEELRSRVPELFTD